MTHDFDARLQLLVIQGSPFCNLNCRYCYLPDRQNKARIGLDTLRAVLDSVLKSRMVSDQLTIVWHAGEPLALPIAFYESAFAVVAEVNQAHGGRVRITHSVQTNGTTLTDAWCTFLKQHGVRIGLSIDGTAELHDQNRVDWQGKGSHARVLRGVRLLQRHHIPFHVITVVTRAAMARADALFAFYLEHDIRQVGFNVEEQEGANVLSAIAGDAVAVDYREFLRRFLRLNDDADQPLVVREFASMAAALRHGDETMRAQDNQAFAMLNVDWQGNCSTWSPELLGQSHPTVGDFALGNLARDRLDDLAATAKFARLRAAIEAGVAACRVTCEYFRLCGGGCPSNKLAEHDSLTGTETAHCRLTRKVLADVVLERFEAVLAES